MDELDPNKESMTNIINNLIDRAVNLKLQIETVAEFGGDEYLFQAVYNMGDVIDSLNEALTAPHFNLPDTARGKKKY